MWRCRFCYYLISNSLIVLFVWINRTYRDGRDFRHHAVSTLVIIFIVRVWQLGEMNCCCRIFCLCEFFLCTAHRRDSRAAVAAAEFSEQTEDAERSGSRRAAVQSAGCWVGERGRRLSPQPGSVTRSDEELSETWRRAGDRPTERAPLISR